jgi:hypothetical protein|tara:strand:+ start:311 stop:487 length:177 start_codon:yes stop_codon:yes gene_type:complete
MIPIYKFEESTLYLCEECLDDVGPISGKWVESTEASCSICGEEAMDNVYKPYREDNDE